MPRKRHMSRRQQQAYFARLAEEGERRRGGLAPRITPNDPHLDKMIAFLSGGKTNDPRVQRIKEKLKGAKLAENRGVSFNPGADPKTKTKFKGHEVRRLVGGRMVSRVYEVGIPGEIEPEITQSITVNGRKLPLPSSGAFDAKEKGTLIERARGFFARREQRTIGRKINRVAEKKTTAKLSSLDEALARQSALLSNPESTPLSKKDEALLKETLKKFGAKDVESSYDITPIEKIYGKKGYHIVPRVTLPSVSDAVKVETRQRVIYPSKSIEAFRKEASLTFPNYKKTNEGEYIPKFNVSKIESAERLGPNAPHRVPVLRVKQMVSGPQPLQAKAMTEGKIDNNDPKKFQTRTVKNWKTGSPFREIPRGRDIPHRDAWDAMIAARKEGRAFIINEQGQRLEPPSVKRLEKKVSQDKFSGWKPDNLFDLAKWNSEFTTDKEREDLFNKHIKELERNPLRKMLEEAEYHTAVKQEKDILGRSESDRRKRLASEVMKLQTPSVDIRDEARRQFALSNISKVKGLIKEKTKAQARYDKLVSKAREKVALREQQMPAWKKLLRKLKRGSESALLGAAGIASTQTSKLSSHRGSPKEPRYMFTGRI